VRRTIFLFLISSLFVIPCSAVSWQEQPSQAPQEPREPTRRIKKELFELCQETATKLRKQLAADEVPSLDDIRFLQSCTTAKVAANLVVVAESEVLMRSLRKELVQEALQAGERLLKQFNESEGRAIQFIDDDRVRLLHFETVAMAATVLVTVERFRHASSANQTQKIDSQLITSAKGAAERVLEAFNQHGWEARFQSEDEETLRKFSQALDKVYSEKQKQ
jgi:hypothetical protein